ncbi:MAG: hypothetical protein AB9834_04235 [Lentimicrobium sp.]
MTIGLNNIFTSFWFLLMIGGGLKLTTTILPRFDRIDFWMAKFWLIDIMIITIGVIVFFLLKFRILIVNKRKIISFFPFRLKVTIIEKTNIKSIKWTNVSQNATLHKCFQIKDFENNTIEFSDFEFENYYTLESMIWSKQYENSERDKIIIEQATNNIGNSKFLTLILFGLSVFIVGLLIKDSLYMELRLTILFLTLILFLTSARKTMKYIKIKKYGVIT